MSFDLLLQNGDIVEGADGDLDTVTDSPKLVQDVIKMVTTPQGSNKFQPFLGSLVNQRLIETLNQQNMVSVLSSSVQEALVMLQRLQQQQSLTQALSPAETLVSITSITVERDSVEPRQLNVILKIKAADGSIQTETLAMRIM